MRSFYLKLSGDDDLILTPYHAFDPEHEVPGNVELVSADLLDLEEERAATETMKRDAAFSVSRWIQEKRYIARLLVTALIFLAVYFVGSLAVRDPIPMIDELLIAFAISCLFWYWAVKRDGKAQAALMKRDELYREIDRLTETQSQYVRDLEAHYEAFRKNSILDMAEMIAAGKVGRFEVYEDHREIHEEFRRLLHAYLSDTFRKELRIIEDIEDGKLTGHRCVTKIGSVMKTERRSSGHRMSPYFMAFILSVL